MREPNLRKALYRADEQPLIRIADIQRWIQSSETPSLKHATVTDPDKYQTLNPAGSAIAEESRLQRPPFIHRRLHPRSTSAGAPYLEVVSMFNNREKRTAKKAQTAQVERHSTLKYPYRLNL